MNFLTMLLSLQKRIRVDNSIVVLENIYRYSAEGHSRMESCVDGTKEVLTSLTASTLTTVGLEILWSVKP